jgi:hypothetical protein
MLLTASSLKLYLFLTLSLVYKHAVNNNTISYANVNSFLKLSAVSDLVKSDRQHLYSVISGNTSGVIASPSRM